MKQLRNIVIVFLLIVLWGILSAQTTNVLQYTETTGYNHNTKTDSYNMFTGFNLPNVSILNSDSSAPFDTCYSVNANGDTVLNFDVIIWSNTSGCNGLDANQRAMFEAWVKAGGSCIVIHAGFDTYRHSSANGNCTGNFDFYAEEVAGGSVQQSPNHTKNNYPGTITPSGNHVTQTALPNPWNKPEEYYYWENGYLNPTFTEVFGVGSTGSKSYDNPRMVAQIKETAWCGRMFSTSLGHNRSDFQSNANFHQLMMNALTWVAEDPCVAPFGIFFDNPNGGHAPVLREANISDGYIVLSDIPEVLSYRVWTLSGKAITAGEIQEGRIPLESHPEPLIYWTYGQIFKVRNR